MYGHMYVQLFDLESGTNLFQNIKFEEGIEIDVSKCLPI